MFRTFNKFITRITAAKRAKARRPDLGFMRDELERLLIERELRHSDFR